MEYDDAVDEDRQDPDWAMLPTSLKGLRACIPCLLIKQADQFRNDGCENCPFLEDEDHQLLMDALTPNFEGMVSMMEPNVSWVAKWQRIDKMVPGCYAIKVHGEVGDEVEQVLKDNNRPNLGKMSQED